MATILPIMGGNPTLAIMAKPKRQHSLAKAGDDHPIAVLMLSSDASPLDAKAAANVARGFPGRAIKRRG
jgi:methenyltetrahydromethanopterin cyclohydrolase